MKKFQINGVKQILFTLFAMLVSLPAFSQDIEVANSDGITIYYNWENNNTELSVTSHPSDSYLGKVVIPETVTYDGKSYPVTSIGEGAFEGCEELTSVVIPNGVIRIGEGAFEDCTGLTSIKIPNSVTSIGDEAFYGCKGLTAITIPNSVTSIGKFAFGFCSELKYIAIKEGVKNIDDDAFTGCEKVSDVVCYSKNAEGNNSWVQYYHFMLHVPIEALEAYESTEPWCNSFQMILGEDLRDDNCNTFRYRFNIDDKTASIEKFVPLSSDVQIPTRVAYKGVEYSVTSIREGAFGDCTGLTSVTIPEGIQSIGYEAFFNCSGLTSVKVPNSVTQVGHAAFWYCGLQDPVYNDKYFFFLDGSYQGECVIPAGIEVIAPEAFSNCQSLTSVSIPSSVTTIGVRAFFNCSGLTSIVIPNNVTNIGEGAFWFCTGLTSVTSLNTTPPILESMTFSEMTTKNATLYVPTGCKAIYSSSPYWKDFAKIEEIDVTNIGNIIPEEEHSSSMYQLNGIKANDGNLGRGIYIQNGKKVLVK